jgi:hypothetical protein
MNARRASIHGGFDAFLFLAMSNFEIGAQM